MYHLLTFEKIAIALKVLGYIDSYNASRIPSKYLERPHLPYSKKVERGQNGPSKIIKGTTPFQPKLREELLEDDLQG